MKMQYFEYMNDYDEEQRAHSVYFNKKRLLRAFNELGYICSLKDFLKTLYISDDTEALLDVFDSHGWKYKDLVKD